MRVIQNISAAKNCLKVISTKNANKTQQSGPSQVPDRPPSNRGAVGFGCDRDREEEDKEDAVSPLTRLCFRFSLCRRFISSRSHHPSSSRKMHTCIMSLLRVCYQIVHLSCLILTNGGRVKRIHAHVMRERETETDLGLKNSIDYSVTDLGSPWSPHSTYIVSVRLDHRE